MSDEEHLEALKLHIEGLADFVSWSQRAYTPMRTVHKIIRDGFLAEEGDITPGCEGDLAEMCAATLAVAMTLRRRVRGEATLVWRCEPEVRVEADAKVHLYTRLCFEPVLRRVATGVWVESSLQDGGGW